MKETFTPIITCVLDTLTNGLIKGLEDSEIKERLETIETTALIRSARILRAVLEHEVTCCHSDFSERPSRNADVKNSQGVIIITMIKEEIYNPSIYCGLFLEKQKRCLKVTKGTGKLLYQHILQDSKT